MIPIGIGKYPPCESSHGEVPMLDTDEIKTTLEGAYDEVCAKVKETEGTDEEVKWRDIELHLDHILEILDAIGRQKRELKPDPDLSFPAEGDFKRRFQVGGT